MRIAFAAAARRDLKGIVNYIAQDNAAAAVKVADAIRAAVARLADFPEMGHVGRLPDTRELVVASLPYVIVYHVARDALTIIAVFHGARDLASALPERGKHLKA
ncbi:MAG: type II toxin-antitoxin system RelE/ParE family toxin [Gammaproteobacteria bacterium]